MKTLKCYIKIPSDNYKHDFNVVIKEDATEQEVIDTIMSYAVKHVFKIGAENYEFTENKDFLESK